MWFSIVSLPLSDAVESLGDMPCFFLRAGTDSERGDDGAAVEVGKKDVMAIGHQGAGKTCLQSLAMGAAEGELVLGLEGDLRSAGAVATVAHRPVRILVQAVEERVGIGVTRLCRQLACGHFEVFADQCVDIEVVLVAGGILDGDGFDRREQLIVIFFCLFGSAGDPYSVNARRAWEFFLFRVATGTASASVRDVNLPIPEHIASGSPEHGQQIVNPAEASLTGIDPPDETI
jgi:hypothetical protein